MNWKKWEEVVNYSEVLSEHLPKETEEKHEEPQWEQKEHLSNISNSVTDVAV
jgi:hypothetical protein